MEGVYPLRDRGLHIGVYGLWVGVYIGVYPPGDKDLCVWGLSPGDRGLHIGVYRLGVEVHIGVYSQGIGAYG